MPATHTAAFAASATPHLLIPFARTWPVTPVVLAPRHYRDVRFAGFGRVSGDTKVKGIPDFPKYARVRLYDEQTGAVVAEQWSNATTGAWSFDNIDASRRYTVVAYDPEKVYRAVVADNLLPSAMP